MAKWYDDGLRRILRESSTMVHMIESALADELYSHFGIYLHGAEFEGFITLTGVYHSLPLAENRNVGCFLGLLELLSDDECTGWIGDDYMTCGKRSPLNNLVDLCPRHMDVLESLLEASPRKGASHNPGQTCTRIGAGERKEG